MPNVELDDGVKLARKGDGFLESIVNEKAWKFGDMWLFSQVEKENLEKLQKLISEYVKGGNQKKPLCICIFGPPGSGKSFAVKQVYSKIQADLDVDAASESIGKVKLIKQTFNLTQALYPGVLLDEIKKFFDENEYNASKEQSNSDDPVVPFLFFDEFDAPLQGVPLGWLSWFLSPMQDGEFGMGSSQVECKKAIYIFAGGTSDNFFEFSNNQSEEFKKAKGPDFLSRLQSFVNVKGINFPLRRSLRRAFMVSNILQRYGEKKPDLNDDLIKKILRQGRYRHGARSIETILDVAMRQYTSDDDARGFLEERHFSTTEVQSIHLDHGPLDSRNLEGLVGLSVGKELQTHESDGQKFVLDLVNELWSLGATIGYGGKWDTDLTRDIVAESDNVLSTLTKQPKVNVFLRGDREHESVDSAGIEWISAKSYLKVSPLLPEDTFLEKALAGYRMRWLMSSRCSSRILIEGKLNNYSGRMPGVLEEAVMALSLRQPVYVIGKFGGASRVLGQQLGLSDASQHSQIESISFNEEKVDILNTYKEYFIPLGLEDFPMSTTQSLAYIGNFALAGPHWVENGLTTRENIELFNSCDDQEIIQLVTHGLKKLFK